LGGRGSCRASGAGSAGASPSRDSSLGQNTTLAAFSQNGSLVTGDGGGQTIAIVDAYNDPNIASDLRTFSYGMTFAAVKTAAPATTAVRPSDRVPGSDVIVIAPSAPLDLTTVSVLSPPGDHHAWSTRHT
jgi:hypothetical protein